MAFADFFKDIFLASRQCEHCKQTFPPSFFPKPSNKYDELLAGSPSRQQWPRLCHECFPQETHRRNLEAIAGRLIATNAHGYFRGEAGLTSYREVVLQEVAKKRSAGTMPSTLTDREARMRHLYAVGKSGTGKTSFLKFLMLDDLKNGRGFAFLDPHGDAAEELLGLIPPERFDDVIYFAPASKDCPPFNLLALPYDPSKLAADIVSLFKLFFGTSWGPQLQQILNFSLVTLITDRPAEGRHTLADLRRLLLNPEYREEVVARVSHTDRLREFWQLQFPNLKKDAAGPVLNKLDAFMPPLSKLEDLFSRRENALDFPAIMDGRKVLIANLSKGTLGDEPAYLCGGLLTSAITQAALARADRPEAARVPFLLYADEFQNYTTDSLTTILDQARKYALGLTLANQHIPSGDLRTPLLSVGSVVAFQVGAEAAALLAREMHGKTITLENRSTVPLNEVRAYCQRKFASVPQYLPAVLETFEEMAKTGWPTAPDFTLLKPRHTIFRGPEAADDVHSFVVSQVPQPNDSTRRELLSRLSEKYRRPATSPPTSSTPPPPRAAIAPKSSPDDADGFGF